MAIGSTFQFVFFLTLFIATFIAVLFLLMPYLHILLLSAIISVVLRNPYEWLVKKCRGLRSGAAIITILVTFVVVGIPLFFVGYTIVDEAKNLYASIDSFNVNTQTFISRISFHGFENLYSYFDIKKYADTVLSFIVNQVGPLLSGTAYIIFELFLLTLTTFFFLIDGIRFKKYLIALSPLSEDIDQRIAKNLEITINSVIRGIFLIACAQGICIAIGFLMTGVPNAILWGTVGTVTSFIPMFGSSIVLMPAVLYLLAVGNTVGAIGLALWSFFVVGLIDNILAPFLYNKGGVTLHPLFILLSILGGLTLFGPLGLIFGPILVSLFFSLLTIYEQYIHTASDH